MKLEDKSRRETSQIELVETYNIMLSLNRLNDAPGCNSPHWKRALYHALSMSKVCYDSDLEKLRQALQLP